MIKGLIAGCNTTQGVALADIANQMEMASVLGFPADQTGLEKGMKGPDSAEFTRLIGELGTLEFCSRPPVAFFAAERHDVYLHATFSDEPEAWRAIHHLLGRLRDAKVTHVSVKLPADGDSSFSRLMDLLGRGHTSGGAENEWGRNIPVQALLAFYGMAMDVSKRLRPMLAELKKAGASVFTEGEATEQQENLILDWIKASLPPTWMALISELD